MIKKEKYTDNRRKESRQRQAVLKKILEKGAIEIDSLASEFQWDRHHFYNIVAELMIKEKVYVPEWTSPIRIVAPNTKEEKFNAIILHKKLLAQRHRMQASLFRKKNGDESRDAAIQDGFANQLDISIKQMLSKNGNDFQ